MTFREDNYRDAGRLNTKIEILQQSPVDDFHGTPEYEVLRECWSEWIPLRGDRLAIFSQQYGVVTSEVTIRMDRELKTGQWIKRKRDGKLAAIAGVIPVDGGNRWQQLIVREIEQPIPAAG